MLNPVRAGMVETAEAWPWSSYHATVLTWGMCNVRPDPLCEVLDEIAMVIVK